MTERVPGTTPIPNDPSVTVTQQAAATSIEAALTELGLDWESAQPGSYLVRLEGQHKLATMTWLIAGRHSLHVEAFFCRQPDEDHARFYRYLLERNGRMYGVHFALDQRATCTWSGGCRSARWTPRRSTGSWAAC